MVVLLAIERINSLYESIITLHVRFSKWNYIDCPVNGWDGGGRDACLMPPAVDHHNAGAAQAARGAGQGAEKPEIEEI